MIAPDRRIWMAVAMVCLFLSAVAFQTRNNFQNARSEYLNFHEISNRDLEVTGHISLLRYLKGSIPLDRALFFMVIGMAAAGIAWWRYPPLPNNPPTAQPKLAINWILLAIGAACLWAVAETNGQLVDFEPLWGLNYHTQYVLLCVGVICTTLGMGGLAPARSTEATYQRGEWRLIVGISLVGLGLRVWHLQAIRVLVDELAFIQGALTFNYDPTHRILVPMNDIFAFPSLYSYWVSAALDVFGHSYAAVRLPSALIGAATVPPVYLLTKNLFDRRTAILAAVLFATFPPHLHFSRLSMLHVCDTLAGTVCLAWLSQGKRTGHRIDFAIAGAALGMTQYFYEAGRFIFPVVTVSWILISWLAIGKPFPWRGVVITVITAVLVAMPVYYTLQGLEASTNRRLDVAGLPDHYWAKLFQASPDDPIVKAQLDRLENPFLHVVSVPDLSVFYAGDTPLLLVYLVPFFFLGVVYIVRTGHSLPLLWLLLPLGGASLLVESGVTVRFVLMFPALMMVCAVGIRYSVPVLVADKKLAWVIMSVLALGFALSQTTYYFTNHLTRFHDQFRTIKPYPDAEDALLWADAKNYHAGTQVVFISDPVFPERYAVDIGTFLSEEYRFKVLWSRQLIQQDMIALQNGFDTVFFLEPSDTDSLNLIRDYFELAPPEYSPQSDQIPDDKEWVLYFAPAFTMESAEPIEWDQTPEPRP